MREIGLPFFAALASILVLSPPFAGEDRPAPSEGTGVEAPPVPAPAPAPEPGAIETRIAAVREILDKDDFETALADARAIVEAEPRHAKARALLGDALYRRGDFEEAEAAYRRSVEIDPSCAEGHYGVGRILRTLGRYGDAAASFHRAAALEPENARYVRTLANHLARREDVVATMQRYLELAPDEEERIRKNVEAWIALLKHLGDEPLGEVVRSAPADLPMNVLRGQAYVKANVNKMKGLRFAFDTGSTGMTISPGLARRAKVEVIRPFEIVGMGGKGTVAGDLVLIRELSFGPIALRNVAASIAEPKGPEEGLIGPSFFSSFLIRIDLERGTLSLRPRGSAEETGGDEKRGSPATGPHDPPAGTDLAFRNVGGQMVVPATLNGVTLNAMVDTGASSSLSSFSAVPRVPGLEVLSAALSTGRSFGLAGAMARRTVREATLGFAGREFEADGLPSVDLSSFSRTLESEVYLVIGFPELERFILEIDYRTNTLRLEPSP